MADKKGGSEIPGKSPLAEAESDFLQVLLHRFSLSRGADGTGAILRAEFGKDTPAIRQRRAKTEVKKSIKNFKARAKKLQGKFDAVLHGKGEGRVDHDNESFPFRHANGGALPVVSMGDKQYYCFHWRDIAPVGWNIANGGSDNRQELLRPELIIERELLEELIVIDPRPGRACRYVFETDEGGQSIDRDAEAAWREWRKRFVDIGYPAELGCRHRKLPLMWLGGPDRLAFEFDGELQAPVKGVFLNVNAEDFGIEIDRVVHLRLPEGAVLCDGELLGGQLLDSAIGLFEVGKVHRGIRRGERKFLPDHLFHSGQVVKPHELEEVKERFLKDKERRKQRAPADRTDLRKAEKKKLEFDLCPVTRSVVRRHMTTFGRRAAAVKGKKLDVFLSFASEDRVFADRVCRALESANLKVFFSDKTLDDTDYGRAIDKALAKARCLIAVGTKADHLTKGWPEYEWRSFHQEMLSGTGRGRELISLIHGFNPADLPRQLRFRQAVECYDPESPEAVLPKLLRFVGGG